MKTPHVFWRLRAGRFSEGSECLVGPFVVAGTERLFGTKTVPGVWQAISYLPGLNVKKDLNHYATEADAKVMAELLVTRWFERIAKEQPPREPASSGD